jgi:hypothetical protein
MDSKAISESVRCDMKRNMWTNIQQPQLAQGRVAQGGNDKCEIRNVLKVKPGRTGRQSEESPELLWGRELAYTVPVQPQPFAMPFTQEKKTPASRSLGLGVHWGASRDVLRDLPCGTACVPEGYVYFGWGSEGRVHPRHRLRGIMGVMQRDDGRLQRLWWEGYDGQTVYAR